MIGIAKIAAAVSDARAGIEPNYSVMQALTFVRSECEEKKLPGHRKKAQDKIAIAEASSEFQDSRVTQGWSGSDFWVDSSGCQAAP